ncbi:hypothetical protein AYI70_g9254 [Smittium culicis]|uniref:Uncharacterized protein n=1 Tax=Smittium culicis TaxID=133412 RepID=A0A1R1XC62_9FUNG|nr:hypothetical protein AYI70_g9254 [Smittium culicis]
MDYQPQLLNDSYSTAAKKDDITLNVIQVDLAQATRLIDYYVHRRIQETSEGPKSEIQGVQRGPKRLGRFCKDAAAPRSSDGTANIYITPAAQQTEDQLRVPPDPDGGSRLSLIKKRHRGSLYQDSRFLQQPLRDSKEDRWTQICFRSEEVKYTSQSTAIRTVTKSVYFHQDSLPDIFMDENTENPGFSVLGRSIDSREFEGTIFDERRHSVHRIYSSWVQDQIGEVVYYPDSINQAPRNGDKLARDYPQGTSNQDQGPQTRSLEDHKDRNGHVYSPSSGVIDFEETLRAEEHLPLQKEIVDIECDPDRAGDPEFTILYQPTEILELTFLPTREPRT